MSDINTAQSTSVQTSAHDAGNIAAAMQVQERRIARIALMSELVVLGVMLVIGAVVASNVHMMTIAMSTLVLIAVAGCAYVLRTWPFGYRDETKNFSRMLAGLAMMISVIELERTGMLGEYVTSTEVDMFSTRLVSHWAIVIVILLVCVLLVSFARQMAREPRSHLIVSLSVGLMATIVTLGGASWAFLPLLVAQSLHHTYGAVLFVVYIVVLVLALCATSIWLPKHRENITAYGSSAVSTSAVSTSVPTAVAAISNTAAANIYSQSTAYGSTALPVHASPRLVRRRGIGRGVAMAMMAGYGAYVIVACITILHVI